MNDQPKRRVLFVINDLARAGAETQLVELALHLDCSRYETAIVLLKERNQFAAELRAQGIAVTALRRRGFWDVGVPYRLYRTVKAFRPDIVHGYLFLANLMAALVARPAGARTLVLSQRCSYEATLSPLVRLVARFSHARADRVIVNSQAAWEEEVAAGFSRDRLVFVPNGVRTEQAAADRTTLGLPAGPLVISVGTLDAVKGHRHLLQAWPAVRARVPDAHLALVGDGPERETLPRLADSLSIRDSVLFVGFRSPAAPYLAAADVVALPSLTEGMPNVVLEAMALGRPVVGTRVGGIPELIVDGETGLLVPARDEAALASAIAGLLADDERRKAMGVAARRRTVERFSVAAMAAATEAVYDAALGDSSEPSVYTR